MISSQPRMAPQNGHPLAPQPGHARQQPPTPNFQPPPYRSPPNPHGGTPSQNQPPAPNQKGAYSKFNVSEPNMAGGGPGGAFGGSPVGYRHTFSQEQGQQVQSGLRTMMGGPQQGGSHMAANGGQGLPHKHSTMDSNTQSMALQQLRSQQGLGGHPHGQQNGADPQQRLANLQNRLPLPGEEAKGKAWKHSRSLTSCELSRLSKASLRCAVWRETSVCHSREHHAVQNAAVSVENEEQIQTHCTIEWCHQA